MGCCACPFSKRWAKKRCGTFPMANLPAPFDPAGLRRGNITYFPVAPGRMEFAIELRHAMIDALPDVVAVELPGFLEERYLQAVARMPEMSVILYEDPSREDSAIYLPVEPCDPFVEALRTGIEMGATVVFLEPDAAERPHLKDAYPDPYAIRRIGLERYIEAYRVYPQERGEEIREHAAAMAWKLQGADPLAQIFVVMSLYVLDALLDAMEIPQEPPARRRSVPRPQLVSPHPDCLAEITTEYPYLQERYERFRI